MQWAENIERTCPTNRTYHSGQYTVEAFYYHRRRTVFLAFYRDCLIGETLTLTAARNVCERHNRLLQKAQKQAHSTPITAQA